VGGARKWDWEPVSSRWDHGSGADERTAKGNAPDENRDGKRGKQRGSQNNGNQLNRIIKAATVEGKHLYAFIDAFLIVIGVYLMAQD
jgi:hypothetical protein